MSDNDPSDEEIEAALNRRPAGRWDELFAACARVGPSVGIHPGDVGERPVAELTVQHA